MYVEGQTELFTTLFEAMTVSLFYQRGTGKLCLAASLVRPSSKEKHQSSVLAQTQEICSGDIIDCNVHWGDLDFISFSNRAK